MAFIQPLRVTINSELKPLELEELGGGWERQRLLVADSVSGWSDGELWSSKSSEERSEQQHCILDGYTLYPSGSKWTEDQEFSPIQLSHPAALRQTYCLK